MEATYPVESYFAFCIRALCRDLNVEDHPRQYYGQACKGPTMVTVVRVAHIQREAQGDGHDARATF